MTAAELARRRVADYEFLADSPAERSAGGPRDGDAAGARADAGEPDYRFVTERDLRYVRGYVINRHTGEVLSSVIEDVAREHKRPST